MEEKRSWWQKIRKPLRIVGIIAVCVLVVGLIVAIIGGYHSNWDWTGFNSGTSQITITSTSKVNYTATIPQPSKSLWDWLGLLAVLAIPVVVGIGAAWYTSQQGKVSDRENTDNQRQAVLQAYIDKMSELLLDKHLGELLPDGKADQKYRQQQNGNIKDELKPEYEAVRDIARVLTLTVLLHLDGGRKATVLNFLSESGLIKKNKCIIDLIGANLSGANLSQINVTETYRIYYTMKGDDLSGAILSKANLSGANLSEADLSAANLNEANLSTADLSRANLSYAGLSRANLSKVYLSGADLSEADLKGAIGVTLNELERQAKSLKGATMPDGSIHP